MDEEPVSVISKVSRWLRVNWDIQHRSIFPDPNAEDSSYEAL